ncbi:MFS transporter [Cupriavidus sp. TMH.W2]|uniref:MFS transporter n=1 Tax=Cupriavidus sp. TMH.W2 TaxID=3434465 RepID=UPI003D784B36
MPTPTAPSRYAGLRPALPILIGASVMLSLAMGLRQSLGIFMPPLTRDIGISVSDFTIAIAVQNLAWGLLQPLAGAWATRIGFRPLMVAGSLLYIVGLVLLATAHSLVGVTLGAGVAIGASMACTGSALAMAVAARPVSAALRSTVLGLVSGAGSLGALLAAPIGQMVTQAYGWRTGLAAFVVLALVMLPAAWFAGRVDRLPLVLPAGRGQDSAREALGSALRHAPFVVMALAYFVCGMQLVFLTTHLPSYLDVCGMDPMLSAQALGVIGGFNVLGSIFFGWAGGRFNKLMLLGCIYTIRSLALTWYFSSAPTPQSTLVFAAVMGFLWLGVAPLVSGWIAETFGLRWQAMLGGVAFFSHQIGSFVGAFGGGVVYDALGSYTVAWQVGVALGLTAGVAQIAFAVATRRRPPLMAAS